MTTKATSPHMAIVHMSVEIHEVLPTGECSGKIVKSSELAEFGLKPTFVLRVKGFDKFECIKKLKALMEKFDG